MPSISPSLEIRGVVCVCVGGWVVVVGIKKKMVILCLNLSILELRGLNAYDSVCCDLKDRCHMVVVGVT